MKGRRQLLFKVAQLQKIEEHDETENEEDIDEVLDSLNLPSKGSEGDTDSDSAFGSDTNDLAF